jgi:hypothetical protein
MYAIFIVSATLAAFGLLRQLLMGAMWKLTSVFDFTMNKFSTPWSGILFNLRIKFVSNPLQQEGLAELSG